MPRCRWSARQRRWKDKNVPRLPAEGASSNSLMDWAAIWFSSVSRAFSKRCVSSAVRKRSRHTSGAVFSSAAGLWLTPAIPHFLAKLKIYRTREYLTAAEVERLIAAARKHSRYPDRDAALILVIYSHGLRASEACDLEWSQVDFDSAALHVRRAKNGKPASHPIRGDEMRALRKLHRDQEPKSAFMFTSERGTPFTPDALNRHLKRLGTKTTLGFPVHAHMLRHACGFALANAGHDTRAIQDYLGHKAIQHHGSIYRTDSDALQRLLALKHAHCESAIPRRYLVVGTLWRTAR